MARVGETVVLTEQLIQELVAKYSELPAAFLSVDQRVLRKAFKLADDNYRRITKEPDGSLIVWNFSVW